MLFEKKYIPKIWGGEKFENFFSSGILDKKLGESWEISVIKGFESVVNNGVFKNKKPTCPWEFTISLYIFTSSSYVFIYAFCIFCIVFVCIFDIR